MDVVTKGLSVYTSFTVIMIICCYTVEWHTQTRFGLVGPIISAHQPFYYNSQITFCLACVQVGVLQLNEIGAACVGWMMQIFD